MTDQEKLVEMISHFFTEMHIENTMKPGGAEELADYMVFQGVTVNEQQKPLTVEELPEYLGKIIWKEEPFMELVPVEMFFAGAVVAEYEEFGIAEDCESLIGDYNHSWRCWAEKPTEEERKAAEWKE